MAFGGDEGLRGNARGGLERKCATVQSAREGAIDIGSRERFSQIPWRDGVAGASGSFARGVGGTFRAIAIGFGGRIGVRKNLKPRRGCRTDQWTPHVGVSGIPL